MSFKLYRCETCETCFMVVDALYASCPCCEDNEPEEIMVEEFLEELIEEAMFEGKDSEIWVLFRYISARFKTKEEGQIL